MYHDLTLRDGSHAISHQVTEQMIIDYCNFAEDAGIEVPGYNATDGRQYVNAIGGVGIVQKIANALKTNESEESGNTLKRLKDF